METGKSVNICLLKYSQRVMSSLNMGKKLAKPMCGERFSRTWTFFSFFGRIAPHTLPPMPLPEIKVLRKIIPFQLGKGHFDGEVLDVKEGHFHCSFCLLRNGSVPFNQHIPNGTTLESSHKKHSFLETQLTHQHMLGSKHDKQLSKEDGTGCRVTSGSKLHVFPLVQPTVNPSEHNTTFTRSQNLQTPVVAFLLYLSQTCSASVSWSAAAF